MEDQRAIVELDTVFDLGDIVDKEKGAHQWYISINTMDQVCGLSIMWIDSERQIRANGGHVMQGIL